VRCALAVVKQTICDRREAEHVLVKQKNITHNANPEYVTQPTCDDTPHTTYKHSHSRSHLPHRRRSRLPQPSTAYPRYRYDPSRRRSAARCLDTMISRTTYDRRDTEQVRIGYSNTAKISKLQTVPPIIIHNYHSPHPSR
jgi:hypothetical protein